MKLVIEILFSVVGGLGIFLLGMKYMSEGMQAVAGSRLRSLIASVTNNRLFACTVGVAVTCLVQSSSVTTVMVVGLVNSSFMTLRQAIGVIMGANIGTTITGWILVFKIGKYGLPLLGIMAIVYLFSRSDRWRYIAMAIMGVGMVFFGLELMSSGFKPLRSMPEFVEWFHRFDGTTYLGVLKCALAGCVLTMIVQSSSATLGITIGLAEAGLINFPTAAALVMGENIGTTITALLASIGATTNAKRAALSHTIFNITGVLWITAIFQLYMKLLHGVVGFDPSLAVVVDGAETFPYLRRAIALAHSGFNIVNTLIFLPLLPLLAKIVTKIHPEKAVKETPHLTLLTVRGLDAPAIGIQQSQDEIAKMGESVGKMLTWHRTILSAEEEKTDELERKLLHREEILDVIQKEVVEFLSDLVSGNVPHEVMHAARAQLRIADEYESCSDYIATLLKLKKRLAKESLELSAEGMADLLELHDRTTTFAEMVLVAVQEQDRDVLSKAHVEAAEMKRMVRAYRETHLQRVASGQVPPVKSLIYVDMLTAYRKIRDHLINIAEALAA